jgi:hypothetical protein
MKIGYEHRNNVGERYTPSWVLPEKPPGVAQ